MSFVGKWNYMSKFVKRRKLMDFTFIMTIIKLKT